MICTQREVPVSSDHPFSCLPQLLPEYQVAHERAVYKAIAIVADTKKVVKVMDREKLAELRAMSKPSIDIEDLMAAIIMIRMLVYLSFSSVQSVCASCWGKLSLYGFHLLNFSPLFFFVVEAVHVSFCEGVLASVTFFYVSVLLAVDGVMSLVL